MGPGWARGHGGGRHGSAGTLSLAPSIPPGSRRLWLCSPDPVGGKAGPVIPTPVLPAPRASLLAPALPLGPFSCWPLRTPAPLALTIYLGSAPRPLSHPSGSCPPEARTLGLRPDTSDGSVCALSPDHLLWTAPPLPQSLILLCL